MAQESEYKAASVLHVGLLPFSPSEYYCLEFIMFAPNNSGVWLLENGGQFVVKEAPFPRPGDDEILIRNKAVAISPSWYSLSLCCR